jgi:Fe2+ or Zn2+ uptake regulation protein
MISAVLQIEIQKAYFVDEFCKSIANNAIIAGMSQINHQLTQEVTAILRDNGLSITKQRLFVFELLIGKEPLGMYELYELAKGQLDRASLYRIIAVFEELSIVQRINIGWKYKVELSDKFAEHHHHMTCLKCHNVIAINENELETLITQLASSYAFKPTEHQVEVQGLCAACSIERN